MMIHLYHCLMMGLHYGGFTPEGLAAICQASSNRPDPASAPPVPRPGAQHERHEHGGVEQAGSVRGVLPELPEGRCGDEDACAPSLRARPAQVHAVARRCCELAGCRTGTCLACLATRQRNRRASNVSRPSDLVQQTATEVAIRHSAWMDRTCSGWPEPEMDWLWLSLAGIPQTSRR